MAGGLGLDMLIGAFAAGLIGRLLFPPGGSLQLRPRLESIGFGFLIPVFFIVSGMGFDLSALLSSWTVWIRVPLFLGLLLLVRGAPALLVYRGVLPRRQRVAIAVLQSTALAPARGDHRDRPQHRPHATGQRRGARRAAMLSVLILPLAGFGVLGELSAGESGPATLGELQTPDTGLEAEQV